MHQQAVLLELCPYLLVIGPVFELALDSELHGWTRRRGLDTALARCARATIELLAGVRVAVSAPVMLGLFGSGVLPQTWVQERLGFGKACVWVAL